MFRRQLRRHGGVQRGGVQRVRHPGVPRPALVHPDRHHPARQPRQCHQQRLAEPTTSYNSYHTRMCRIPYLHPEQSARDANVTGQSFQH